MDNKLKIHLATMAGLIHTGEEDNEPQFMGTEKQWEEYERRKDKEQPELIIIMKKDGLTEEINKKFSDPHLFEKIREDIQYLQEKWGSDLF